MKSYKCILRLSEKYLTGNSHKVIKFAVRNHKPHATDR